MSSHRIDFAQFDVIVMQVGSPGVTPQVLLTWTIEPVRTAGDEISFIIERSQNPDFTDTDGIEQIAEPISGVQGQSVYEYLDVTVNLQSFWRRYYYRITIEDLVPARSYYSDVKTWSSDPKTFELEIIARHNWLLQYETGTPCFAIIERTAGADHCQNCYNSSMSRSEVSNCPSCFGTGRERPYFQPILTYVDMNPEQKVTLIQFFGELQSGQKDIWWSAFPQLKPRDILVEVISGKRWRVNAVNPITVDIHHFARIEEINRRDAEYRIAIDPTIQREAVAELSSVKKERRF